MIRKGFSKKVFALILSFVMMVSMSLPAFAMTSVFGTGGSGSNPFTPRGYSIMEDGTQYWLTSNYTHTYKRPTDNVHSAVWTDESNPQNPLTEIYYVTSGDKQMYAWVDKGQLTSGYNLPFQRGFTTDSTVDVRYFFVVSINDGPFVTVPYAEAAEKNLTDSNGNIDATQGLSTFKYANRSVIDPDGLTNDWVYPLTFTLEPGTKYTFAYLRGFAANNGMSLILSPDTTTTDGKAGYTGVLQGPTLADSEKAEWAAHYNDMYQYAYAFTDLGLGTTGKEVYSVEFKDFYHTLQTYADLTALNSKFTEAAAFADSVTDNDYKLGSYRKSSVEALKALIDEINAKTNLDEELQTTVDALTKQLSDALDYAKEPAILVQGVTLDNNRADMNVGETFTLAASVSPENADNPTVTWASSNDKTATVQNGIVKAVSAGDVTITATTADGGYTATCAIVVNNVDKTAACGDSSVNVDYNTSALPAGVSVGSVKNNAVTSGEDKTGIENALNGIGFTNLLINEMQLLDTDGNPITSLTGNVTVKIRIPDGAADKALSVFWYNPETGELTDMNAAQQNGFLVFNTNHFSYYVIAKANASANTTSSTSVSNENPETSDKNMPMAVYMAGLLSMAVLLAVRPGKRRKNWEE